MPNHKLGFWVAKKWRTMPSARRHCVSRFLCYEADLLTIEGSVVVLVLRKSLLFQSLSQSIAVHMLVILLRLLKHLAKELFCSWKYIVKQRFYSTYSV